MPPTAKRNLVLQDLGKGLPAITPAYGTCLAEAGAVCFEDNGHCCGVLMEVQGHLSDSFAVHWPTVTQQMRLCWNDLEFTTEQGAYGVAFLVLMALTPFTVIRRSRKGPHFDYWLGYKDSVLFQDAARLEVSGIRKGDTTHINARVKQKFSRAENSPNSLPLYVAVVEFGKPASKVVKG